MHVLVMHGMLLCDWERVKGWSVECRVGADVNMDS